MPLQLHDVSAIMNNTSGLSRNIDKIKTPQHYSVWRTEPQQEGVFSRNILSMDQMDQSGQNRNYRNLTVPTTPKGL